MTTGSNSQPLPSEQRLHPRYLMHLPVRITEIGGEQELNIPELVTANISSGGAFITTAFPPPVASRIALEFLISFTDLKRLRFILSLESLRRFEGKPVWVKATGVVIRHEESGMAVIFDDDYQLSPMDISA